MPTKPLNPNHLEFCRQYAVDRNGTQAAIRAGYSENGAAVTANRLLTNPKIVAEIQRLTDESAKRTGITVDEIMQNFRTIAERCMQGVEVLDKKGEPTGEWKFDSGGANRANELMGKHKGMFTDKIQIDLSNISDEQLLRVLGMNGGKPGST